MNRDRAYKYVWKKVEDDDVRHVWECPTCGEKTTVYPDWYTDNGTPVCTGCDDDMEYSYTELKT